MVSACCVEHFQSPEPPQNHLTFQVHSRRGLQHPFVWRFSGGVWSWELPLFHFLGKASPELLDVKGLETHQRVAHNEFSCLFPWLPHWRAAALLCPSPLVRPKKRWRCHTAPSNECSRVRSQSTREHSCSGSIQSTAPSIWAPHANPRSWGTAGTALSHRISC